MNMEHKTSPETPTKLANKEPQHLSFADGVYERFEMFTFREQVEITQRLRDKLGESIRFAIDSQKRQIDEFNNEIEHFLALLKQISPD